MLTKSTFSSLKYVLEILRRLIIRIKAPELIVDPRRLKFYTGRRNARSAGKSTRRKILFNNMSAASAKKKIFYLNKAENRVGPL